MMVQLPSTLISAFHLVSAMPPTRCTTCNLLFKTCNLRDTHSRVCKRSQQPSFNPKRVIPMNGCLDPTPPHPVIPASLPSGGPLTSCTRSNQRIGAANTPNPMQDGLRLALERGKVPVCEVYHRFNSHTDYCVR